MTPKYQSFLTQELPTQLRSLAPTQAPNFGLMTAHHMVEHLIYVTKIMMKRKGEPDPEAKMSKSQRFFRNFIDAGCPFEHRPKKGATLNELRTSSIEEAIQILEGANQKFYDLFTANPAYKSYHPMMGAFNMPEIESFQYQHGRWHLHQFGIIEIFTPLAVAD
ncbi:MAG: hypothetical protein AAF985_16060 [Bacteroidota bacterium]